MFVKRIELNCINRERDAHRLEASRLAAHAPRPRCTPARLNGVCRMHKWYLITPAAPALGHTDARSKPQAAALPSPACCQGRGGFAGWMDSGQEAVVAWESRGGGRGKGGQGSGWGGTQGPQVSIWTRRWALMLLEQVGREGDFILFYFIYFLTSLLEYSCFTMVC